MGAIVQAVRVTEDQLSLLCDAVVSIVGDLIGGSGRPDWVHVVPSPDRYRGLVRGDGDDVGSALYTPNTRRGLPAGKVRLVKHHLRSRIRRRNHPSRVRGDRKVKHGSTIHPWHQRHSTIVNIVNIGIYKIQQKTFRINLI